MILLFNGRILRFLVSFYGFQPPFFREMVVKSCSLEGVATIWQMLGFLLDDSYTLTPPITNMDPENSHFWRRKTSSKPPFFGLKGVKLVNQPRRNRWPRTCRNEMCVGKTRPLPTKTHQAHSAGRWEWVICVFELGPKTS